MKILIIGNISSGKSTVGKLLVNQFKDFGYLSIDSIRKVYGDGSENSEEECKKIFIKRILENENQIIEFSGIGKQGEAVVASVKNEKNVLIINPNCSSVEIKRRNDAREWDTPFPYAIDNIPIAVVHTKDVFSDGLLQKYIDALPNVVLYSFSNESQELLASAVKDIFSLMRNRG